MGKTGQCVGGGKTSRTPAGGFFGAVRMRGGICAKEKFCIPRGGGFAQGFLMGAAFDNRQTIIMRPNPAHKHVVAIDHQMMCGDRSRNVGSAFLDIGDPVHCGDMFQCHF